MKILTQKSDVWGLCPLTKDEAILRIEKAGRTCYRSEDKIVEGSGKVFVDNIIRRGHLSVIEHSNMVIRSPHKAKNPRKYLEDVDAIYNSPFITSMIHNDYVYSAGNYRAWIEQLNLETIDDIFDFHDDLIVTDVNEIPLELHAVSVEFLTDRAVTHELVRHRLCAFSQESQRYCAYKQHLEVILPFQYEDIPKTKDSIEMACYHMWVQSVEYAEKAYKYLLSHGERAEKARSVLPNQTATKIVVTAYIPEWIHIFNLRTSAAAYPGIRNLINPVKQVFHENDWI